MKDLLLSKRFQVHFRSLQKPSRKWIQSISPPRINVANKLAKVACTTCIPLSLKCGPFVRLFSRGIGQATSSLLSRFFRVSMLDSKDSKPNSIIDARSSRGSRIEDRVSILDSKETVNLHLPGTVIIFCRRISAILNNKVSSMTKFKNYSYKWNPLGYHENMQVLHWCHRGEKIRFFWHMRSRCVAQLLCN